MFEMIAIALKIFGPAISAGIDFFINLGLISKENKKKFDLMVENYSKQKTPAKQQDAYAENKQTLENQDGPSETKP